MRWEFPQKALNSLQSMFSRVFVFFNGKSLGRKGGRLMLRISRLHHHALISDFNNSNSETSPVNFELTSFNHIYVQVEYHQRRMAAGMWLAFTIWLVRNERSYCTAGEKFLSCTKPRPQSQWSYPVEWWLTHSAQQWEEERPAVCCKRCSWDMLVHNTRLFQRWILIGA